MPPTKFKDKVRNFYEENLRGLEFGNAVADVILVPLLALNLVGAIAIRGPYLTATVAIFAFIDVTSTAILLVAGYVGRSPKLECPYCKSLLKPIVSAWLCDGCGAKLQAPKKVHSVESHEVAPR